MNKQAHASKMLCCMYYITCLMSSCRCLSHYQGNIKAIKIVGTCNTMVAVDCLCLLEPTYLMVGQHELTQSCSAVKSVTIEETISLKLPENKYTIIVTAEASRSPKQSQKCESHMNDPVLPSRTLVLIAAQPTPILHLSYLQHFADTSGKCLFTFLFCWLYVVPKKRLCPQLQICHPWKLLQSAWK